MSLSFVLAFDSFGFLKKGRFEAYGPRVVSEATRTMCSELTNKGRKVAIEAAIIPRFISSLS